VQRAVITLRAKAVEFDITYIDLTAKPDWFLKISPHGKVPVLKVDDVVLFESNAIAEYLEEAVEPHLHPADLIKRARNRAWTDYIGDFSKALLGVYLVKSEDQVAEALENARGPLAKLEKALAGERDNDGPYFNGTEMSLVDAAYAPFFMRFTQVDEKLKTGLLDEFPLLKAWSDALLSSEVVQGSVAPSFPEKFVQALHRRESFAAPLMQANIAA
jgi:glutathione S-transferase